MCGGLAIDANDLAEVGGRVDDRESVKLYLMTHVVGSPGTNEIHGDFAPWHEKDVLVWQVTVAGARVLAATTSVALLDKGLAGGADLGAMEDGLNTSCQPCHARMVHDLMVPRRHCVDVCVWQADAKAFVRIGLERNEA